jgi:hypothetical protein
MHTTREWRSRATAAHNKSLLHMCWINHAVNAAHVYCCKPALR